MTIPNVITLLRFFLVPGVVFALLSGRMEWALAGFVIAGGVGHCASGSHTACGTQVAIGCVFW